MKPFHLDSDMLTLRGHFYPTGCMFLLFTGEQAARDAAKKLGDAGVAADDITLVTPEDIQGPIARTIGSTDMTLPSPGTEADTVRQYVDLASKGHYALLVRAPDSDDSDRAMEALRGCPISYGQKYRKLVIEDIGE